MPNPNPDPNCPKCKGSGWFAYDHNHMTVCNACCPHDGGRWLLKEYYGDKNGKWCCLLGCGHTADTKDG